MENTTLNKDIEKAFSQMRDYLRNGSDGKSFIFDPNDSSRVIGHYGETHYCAAMLFYSERCGNSLYFETALSLLEGILEHWKADEQAPDYHADFNNFALALIYERLLQADKTELVDRVANRLIEASDSKNHTVNWLPMRAYVNLLRYKLTNSNAFLSIAIESLNTVKSAQYQDGLFDDLLPKGQSFNLQYCISTAATVQLIYNRFKEFSELLPKIDVKKTMSTLYALVLPDGDVNYMGRGCNQIFAWGPWKYLMAAYKNDTIAGISLDFLENRFGPACRNENLMLNGYSGKERALWWDYHHFTVYMAHFLLWNELSLTCPYSEYISDITDPSDSGLHIYKSNEYCAVTFTGRKHYLVERGPTVVALWGRKQGVIFKCGHGASNGVFAKKYFNPILAFFNHFGIIEIEQKPKRIENKYLRKFCKLIAKDKFSVQLIPEFYEAQIEIKQEDLIIAYDIERTKSNGYFIFPSFCELDHIQLSVDGQVRSLRYIGKSETQYGDIQLYLAELETGKKCELRFMR